MGFRAQRLMTTRRRWLWMIAVGVVAGLMAIAPATERAGAQVTAAPPLTGTSLQASEFAGVPEPGTTIEITANCDLPQPEISWTVTGVATGTYSGPYTETGTATLTGTVGAGFTFTAEFTIDSPLGFVSGTKGVTVQVATGSCEDAIGQARFGAMAPYTATITTATGTCTTDGMSSITVQEQSTVGPFESFSETFLTGSTPVCTPSCPPDDGEDGDDLNDSGESIFSTLLGTHDSALDRIVDGNDANGNGEDDEDEDDDENDGCPDDDDDDRDDDDDDDNEEDDDD